MGKRAAFVAIITSGVCAAVIVKPAAGAPLDSAAGPRRSTGTDDHDVLRRTLAELPQWDPSTAPEPPLSVGAAVVAA